MIPTRNLFAFKYICIQYIWYVHMFNCIVMILFYMRKRETQKKICQGSLNWSKFSYSNVVLSNTFTLSHRKYFIFILRARSLIPYDSKERGRYWDFITFQTMKIFLNTNSVTEGGGGGGSRFLARNKWRADDVRFSFFVPKNNLRNKSFYLLAGSLL